MEPSYGDELSTTNHAIFYEGNSVGDEPVECTCEKIEDGKFRIKLAKTFTKGDISRSEILVNVEYRLMKNAVLIKESRQTGTRKTHKIRYMTMRLSDFNFDSINKIMGSAKFKLPVAFGFTGKDKTIHFRFRCEEGDIANANNP